MGLIKMLKSLYVSIKKDYQVLYNSDLLKILFKYFVLQIIPLSVDLLIFSIIAKVLSLLPIQYINIISSSSAFFVSYNLNTKYIFKVKKSFFRFTIYFFYCFLSIYIFSQILAFLYLNQFPTEMPKIFFKLMLLPISFIINFLFKNIILKYKNIHN